MYPLAEFERLYAQVNNRGRWGPDDEAGTLNFITARHVVEAAKLIQLGLSVSMARPIDTVGAVDHARPALHYMSKLAQHQHDVEPTGNYDFTGFENHGWNVTHIDALCHTVYQGHLYNGVLDREVVDVDGARVQTIEVMKHGIVGRGVLLDVARTEGVDWLEPGTIVTPEMLDAAEKRSGTTVSEGDIAIYRSGATRKRATIGPWNLDEASTGLHPECMAWFHDRRVGALCADGAHDVRPEMMVEVINPIHALALPAMGLCTIDAMDLEAISEVCETQDRWEFFFSSSLLVIPGGTASATNPIAIL